MKKMILLLAFISMNAKAFADGLTATLQHEDNMKPFYGENALKQAYSAASEGDIITLSSGKFNDLESIEKQITIIGNYAFDEKSVETTFLKDISINTNNVKLLGIYFSGTVSLGNIEDCQIKQCRIKLLKATETNYNTKIDQSYVQIHNLSYFHNCNYTYSEIGHFEGSSTTNTTFINCYIASWHYYTCYDNNVNFILSKNSLTASDYTMPKGVYRNCILGFYHKYATYAMIGSEHVSKDYFTCNLPSSSEFYHNVIIDWAGTPTIKYEEGSIHSDNKGVKHDGFGTPPNLQEYEDYGPMGGTGFSAYPSIPRVISKEIDSNTDNEGRINVKLTVKVQP